MVSGTIIYSHNRVYIRISGNQPVFHGLSLQNVPVEESRIHIQVLTLFVMRTFHCLTPTRNDVQNAATVPSAHAFGIKHVQNDLLTGACETAKHHLISCRNEVQNAQQNCLTSLLNPKEKWKNAMVPPAERQPKEPHVLRGDSGKHPPPVKQKPRSR